MPESRDRSSKSFDPAAQSRPPATRLDTEVSYRFGVPLIYVSGELDHDSAGYLQGVIAQELNEQTRALLLDVSELGYMDSGGLSLMFETLATLKDRGWLGMIGAKGGVQKLIELTGLADRPGFRIFPDLKGVQAAVADLQD